METDLPPLSFESLSLRYNLYKINYTLVFFNEFFLNFKTENGNFICANLRITTQE